MVNNTRWDQRSSDDPRSLSLIDWTSENRVSQTSLCLFFGSHQSEPPFTSPTRFLQRTYMHLHIEFLRGRGGGVGPRHVVVCGHVLVAIRGVPAVGAGTPGQGGLKWWQEVIQRPGHDGVVVEGYVQGDDANSETNPWKNGANCEANTNTLPLKCATDHPTLF